MAEVALAMIFSAGGLETADDDHLRCVKVNLPENITAALEQRKLYRHCEEIECDESLLEDVVANYVIVKKILGFIPWQEKFISKQVCTMWKSVVTTLQKEIAGPIDFALSMRPSHIKNGINLLQSECFFAPPMAVFAFANAGGFSATGRCEAMIKCPCDPPCDKEHYILDVLKTQMVVPRECMIAVKACYTSFLPLPGSIANRHAIGQRFGRYSPFIGGIFIPVIPHVKFEVINIKRLGDIQKVFMKTVDKLSETHYVKGALVFVSSSFILQSMDDIIFLNYLASLQPKVPYALGGCIVDDALSDGEDMTAMVQGINAGREVTTDNLINVALFSVPKNFDDIRTEGGNFDMFSIILESSDWSKSKMETAINDFSQKVPHFEHSVVVKMSCVGRDSKHDYEQNFFRTAFPNSPLVGCYGNGELGINLPERGESGDRPAMKRNRPSVHRGQGLGLMYSYATVFVYIGWGKIIRPAETTNKPDAMQ